MSNTDPLREVRIDVRWLLSAPGLTPPEEAGFQVWSNERHVCVHFRGGNNRAAGDAAYEQAGKYRSALYKHEGFTLALMRERDDVYLLVTPKVAS